MKAAKQIEFEAALVNPTEYPYTEILKLKMINLELLEAANQVIWKLNHNHDLPDYKGPGRITREDATVRMLVDAVTKAEGKQ